VHIKPRLICLLNIAPRGVLALASMFRDLDLSG
jgi:hypothetical protein